jgi:hypothetical protein
MLPQTIQLPDDSIGFVTYFASNDERALEVMLDGGEVAYADSTGLVVVRGTFSASVLQALEETCEQYLTFWNES